MTEKIHPLAMPLAVFAGGALIAAAVFFSSGNVPAQPAQVSGSDTSSEEITLPAPSEEDYVKGDIDAEIVIVEYSDPECPFCKKFHDTMNEIVSEYESHEVAWIYRNFPIDSLHPNATTVAHAFECAGELGGNDGFWSYADELFRVSPQNSGIDITQLPALAEDVGLSRADFQSCMDSERHVEKIHNQINDALTAAESAGHNPGTPYSIAIVTETGEKFAIRGAQEFSTIKSQIDAILNN